MDAVKYPTCPRCGHAEHFQPCIRTVITSELRGVRFDPCDCQPEEVAA